MAKERKDKLKNKITIAKEVLKDPLLTDRQIESKTWVSKSVANRARQELGQYGTKDPIISEICKQDIGIVKKANMVRDMFTDEAVRKITVFSLIKQREFDKLNENNMISVAEYERLTSWDESKIEELEKKYKPSKSETALIDKMSETSQKRYSIFMWGMTDDKWWYNGILWDMTMEALLKKFQWMGWDWEE